MTVHLKRFVGLCFLLLVCYVAAPPVADWLYTQVHLPPGYGAAGDRQRSDLVPPSAWSWPPTPEGAGSGSASNAGRASQG
jgi:hypothetical protein